MEVSNVDNPLTNGFFYLCKQNYTFQYIIFHVNVKDIKKNNRNFIKNRKTGLEV